MGLSAENHSNMIDFLMNVSTTGESVAEYSKQEPIPEQRSTLEVNNIDAQNNPLFMETSVDEVPDKEKPVSPAYLASSCLPETAQCLPLLPVTTTTRPATPAAAAANTASAARATTTTAAEIPPYPASGPPIHQNQRPSSSSWQTLVHEPSRTPNPQASVNKYTSRSPFQLGMYMFILALLVPLCAPLPTFYKAKLLSTPSTNWKTNWIANNKPLTTNFQHFPDIPPWWDDNFHNYSPHKSTNKATILIQNTAPFKSPKCQSIDFLLYQILSPVFKHEILES